MATQTKFEQVTKPLVKITEMDHIVLRTRDVEESLRFYVEVLGLQAERVEQWRAGEVRFPSARLNADTIIDFFASENMLCTKHDHRLLCLGEHAGGQGRAAEPGPLLHGDRLHGHG